MPQKSFLKGSVPSENQSPRPVGWAVLQRADDPDVARANAQLKCDVAGGAMGVALVFEGAHNAFGFGLPAKTDTIARLFDDVDLTGLHLRLDNHPHGRPITQSFIEYLQRQRVNLGRSKITFGVDPTANLATTGKLKMSIAALKASMPPLMSAFFASGLPGIIMEADGRPYHHAGASVVQELGVMLGVAHDFLDMVEAGRHPIVYALPHIGFATALDHNPALGVAKLQALQLLWRRLQESRGVNKIFPLHVHVETSMRMMVRGAHTSNAIRTSYAAVAAAMGGATSLTILPASRADGLADAHARHAALMSQLVLALENDAPTGHFAANQSCEVEHLAEMAWTQYQQYQNQGGVMACLIDGTLSRQFEETRRHTLGAFLKGERMFWGRDSAFVEGELGGIYADKPQEFVTEGLIHCVPLPCTRLEEDCAQAQTTSSPTYF